MKVDIGGDDINLHVVSTLDFVFLLFVYMFWSEQFWDGFDDHYFIMSTP